MSQQKTSLLALYLNSEATNNLHPLPPVFETVSKSPDDAIVATHAVIKLPGPSHDLPNHVAMSVGSTFFTEYNL
jgi:hypothetical protein